MAKKQSTEESSNSAEEVAEATAESNSEKKNRKDKTIANNADNSAPEPTEAHASLSQTEKKAKLKKLLEKAKQLEGAVDEREAGDIKKKLLEEEEEKKDALVPIEDYLKSSIHLGTRVITPDMRQYVYRRRADGLAVFNTALLDTKLREGAAFLSKFAPSDIIVVCKREAGWKAVTKFAQVTGIRYYTKKYPAGILTNTVLSNFTETELLLICDPWIDKNAVEDAKRIGIPVLSICDTNNYTANITKIIPGNNKSAKSIGMIFYLLTKLYVEAHSLPVAVPTIQEFIDSWDELVPPK